MEELQRARHVGRAVDSILPLGRITLLAFPRVH